MNALLLSLAMALVPSSDIAVDSIDIIEINHFYDEQGRLVFDQVIFWRWDEIYGGHRVVAWRLLKKPSQIPRYCYSLGRWRAVWLDGETMRDVRAYGMRETWTQYDPEQLDREKLPASERRKLSGEK